jgi:Fe-S oxidoreductase
LNDAAFRLSEEAGRCIGCGFCESVCPTEPASGYVASRGARGRVILSRELLKNHRGNLDVSAFADSFYSCLDCYACYQVCPAGVNAGLISHYSKEIIGRGGAPPLARMIERMIMRYRSIIPAGRRTSEWARNMEIPDRGSTLLYTGQMYQLMAYVPKLSRFLHRRFPGSGFTASLALRFPPIAHISKLFRDGEVAAAMNASLRDIALLLKSSKIDFFYLFGDEPYPGTLLNDLGFTESFDLYSHWLTDFFRSKGVRRIITVDPHTYDLLKNVIPKRVSEFDFDVSHYLELIDASKLKMTGRKVTFHEPCHLSRRFENFSLPSDMLAKCAVTSMPARSGRNTYCCGGPDELLFPEITGNVSRRRNEQLEMTGAEVTVTACPVCSITLRNDRKVMDIASVLAESSGI